MMNNNNNLDLAIEELIKKRVYEATTSKDKRILELESIVDTLNKGGSYTIINKNYGYSGETRIIHRTLQSNDPAIKYYVEEEVKIRVGDQQRIIARAKLDLEQKVTELKTNYKHMEQGLINSKSWYIKLAFVLKGNKLK